MLGPAPSSCQRAMPNRNVPRPRSPIMAACPDPPRVARARAVRRARRLEVWSLTVLAHTVAGGGLPSLPWLVGVAGLVTLATAWVLRRSVRLAGDAAGVGAVPAGAARAVRGAGAGRGAVGHAHGHEHAHARSPWWLELSPRMLVAHVLCAAADRRGLVGAPLGRRGRAVAWPRLRRSRCRDRRPVVRAREGVARYALVWLVGRPRARAATGTRACLSRRRRLGRAGAPPRPLDDRKETRCLCVPWRAWAPYPSPRRRRPRRRRPGQRPRHHLRLDHRGRRVHRADRERAARLRRLGDHRGRHPDPRGDQRGHAHPQPAVGGRQAGRAARPAGHRRPRQRDHRAGRHRHLHGHHPAARRLPRRLRAVRCSCRSRRARPWSSRRSRPASRASRPGSRCPRTGQSDEELELPAPSVTITAAEGDAHGC